MYKRKDQFRRNAKMALAVIATVGAVIACSAFETPIESVAAVESTENTIEETKHIVMNLETEAVEETHEVEEETTVAETEKERSEEEYLLAKLAMAEAEGEDLNGKALVIRVAENRVSSSEFPNSVEEVIFQKNQFSPISNGRWDSVEPNEECYEALDMVRKDGWDESHGALYFESLGYSKWHQDNLQFLFCHGRHYFYK